MSEQSSSKPQPEKKFGRVAVWLNTTNADDETRTFRSITIAPRRYRDRKTRAWKDAKSYTVADLAVLMFDLQRAQQYCFATPIPGVDDDEFIADDDRQF